jgi:hypothetical protein
MRLIMSVNISYEHCNNNWFNKKLKNVLNKQNNYVVSVIKIIFTTWNIMTSADSFNNIQYNHLVHQWGSALVIFDITQREEGG